MGKTGMRRRAPHPQSIGRQRMWNSMRILRTFTTGDLAAVAECELNNVHRYTKALADAQYLVCVQPKQHGKAAGYIVWRLARNTGPIAPRMSKDGLYDANLPCTQLGAHS